MVVLEMERVSEKGASRDEPERRSKRFDVTETQAYRDLYANNLRMYGFLMKKVRIFVMISPWPNLLYSFITHAIYFMIKLSKLLSFSTEENRLCTVFANMYFLIPSCVLAIDERSKHFTTDLIKFPKTLQLEADPVYF